LNPVFPAPLSRRLKIAAAIALLLGVAIGVAIAPEIVK
jgi:hypothetical protein